MWVILAVLAIPLIEIGLFVVVGGAIGLWPTLIWVVLAASLGVLVLKTAATLGPIRLSGDMKELGDPISPIAHRVLVVIGAGLLLIPGLLTDAIGLLLLIAPVRALVLRPLSKRFSVAAGMTTQGDVIEGEWREVEPRARTNRDKTTLPPSQH